MKRKMKLLRAIRKKKKNQSQDELSPQSDLTGIDMHAAVPETTTPIKDNNEEPTQASIVDPEQDRIQRKNRAIQEMLAKNTYLETLAFSTNATKSHKPKQDSDGGAFFCMCGNLENACCEEKDTESLGSRRIRTYKIAKDSPSEKVGLAFVAFKQQGGIFVCKIKEGSKFNATGLKVGMRVVSINGTPCPERVGALMKMLKKVEKDLELQVERIDAAPKRKVEILIPEREVTNPKTEVDHRGRVVENSKPEVTSPSREVDSSERRLYSSDRSRDDDSDSEPEPDSSDEMEIKAELDIKKLELMRKRMQLMKKKGSITFVPNLNEPHIIPKDVESEDTDETVSSSSAQNVPKKVYDSDSSQGSSTNYTNESSRYNNGMDRFTSMIDGLLVGADKNRLQAEKGNGFTLSEVTIKIKEGAPIWMFFE